MATEDVERRVATAKEQEEWQQSLAGPDQEFFESVRPAGDGIVIGQYGYTLSPASLRDHDARSLCEPPSSSVNYVVCRYQLDRMEDPWSYLRFWTTFLALDGVLVLFINPRHWEWIDRYACWQLDPILEHLGFEPPLEWREMPHGFGRAVAARKGRPNPDGVVFHAGAVVREGKAVLIDGPHGSGKTSLLIRLLSHGWSFLADAFCVVGEDLRAGAGIPLLSVRPGVESVLPQLLGVLSQHPAGFDATHRFSEREHVHSQDWKHRFAVTELPGVTLGEPAPVSGILFPELRDREPVQLRPFSQEAAGTRLRANTSRPYGHNLPAARQIQQEVTAELLARASLFELCLGEGDPVPLIEQALAEAG